MLFLLPISANLTALFVKVSIFLLYLWLFSIKETMRWPIWIGIALQIVAYAAFMGYGIGIEVLCDAETMTTYRICTNMYKIIYAPALFSVVTDFYILLLPLRVVSEMHLSLRTKLGVLGIFMTGLL